MDTRHRVYYFVNLNQNHKKQGWWSAGWDNYGMIYDLNLRKLKQTIHSLKIMNTNLDWRSKDYYQMKVSCKKEEEDTLIKLLNKLSLTDYTKLM